MLQLLLNNGVIFFAINAGLISQFWFVGGGGESHGAWNVRYVLPSVLKTLLLCRGS